MGDTFINLFIYDRMGDSDYLDTIGHSICLSPSGLFYSYNCARTGNTSYIIRSNLTGFVVLKRVISCAATHDCSVSLLVEKGVDLLWWGCLSILRSVNIGKVRPVLRASTGFRLSTNTDFGNRLLSLPIHV